MTTRLRVLSEAEAYARCYASASDDVRVVKIPRRPRYQLDVSGEDLRAAFAERLDKREPEVDAEGAAAADQPVGDPDAHSDEPPAAEEAA